MQGRSAEDCVNALLARINGSDVMFVVTVFLDISRAVDNCWWPAPGGFACAKYSILAVQALEKFPFGPACVASDGNSGSREGGHQGVPAGLCLGALAVEPLV